MRAIFECGDVAMKKHLNACDGPLSPSCASQHEQYSPATVRPIFMLNLKANSENKHRDE